MTLPSKMRDSALRNPDGTPVYGVDALLVQGADTIERLQAQVAAAYLDAAGIGVDYVNDDLPYPDKGIWWHITKRTPADALAALEAIKAEAFKRGQEATPPSQN